MHIVKLFFLSKDQAKYNLAPIYLFILCLFFCSIYCMDNSCTRTHPHRGENSKDGCVLLLLLLLYWSAGRPGPAGRSKRRVRWQRWRRDTYTNQSHGLGIIGRRKSGRTLRRGKSDPVVLINFPRDNSFESCGLYIFRRLWISILRSKEFPCLLTLNSSTRRWISVLKTTFPFRKS